MNVLSDFFSLSLLYIQKWTMPILCTTLKTKLFFN